MLELIEETLNEIGFAVEGEDGGDRSIIEGGDDGGGVERLVGDQSAGIDGFDGRLGASQIVILARAEHHLDRIAEGIDERVNFWWSIRRVSPWLARRFFGRL